MTQKQLIDQFCEFRGKCTTDDVVALNFAYEMLMKSQWISVDDELPKKRGYILVTGRGLVYQWKYEVHESADILKHLFGITHWMRLPQAPKEGE